MLMQVIWFSRGYWAAALAAAVLVLLAVWRLYPAQVRATGGGWRWVLPALRGVALLALAGSLLQPVVARLSKEDRGAVVILVDRSLSMGVVDGSRSPAERVALADGLGLLPAGVRRDVSQGAQERLSALMALLDDVMRSQREVAFARLSGQSPEQAEQRLQRVVNDFRAAAGELAQWARSAPRESGGRGSAAGSMLEEIEKLAHNEVALPPGGVLRPVTEREQWANLVRRRIQRAGDSLRALQARADEQLHEEDEQVRRICDRLATLSRLELVEQALVRPGGLLTELEGRPVFGFSFDESLAALPLYGGGQAVRRLLVEADGTGSNLGGAVLSALEAVKAGGGQRAVSAMVVLSDGRQTGPDGSATPAGGAGYGATTISRVGFTAGAPVFTVEVAPESPPADLAFAEVRLASSAFVGETMIVRARLRQQGLEGRRATVRLEEHGGSSDARDRGRGSTDVTPAATQPHAQQERQVLLGERPATVEFRVKLTEPGARRFVLSIDPMEGEISTANNRVERWVKVLSERMKVGIYAGRPGWDFQYARNALSRAAWVELRDGVLHGGAALGLSPDDILGLDLLILSDVEVTALSEAQWDAVVQLVRERGGSVILVAGGAEVPRQYARHLLLKDLLPYRDEAEALLGNAALTGAESQVDAVGASAVWRRWPGEEPFFQIIRTPEAESIDALSLGGEDIGSEDQAADDARPAALDWGRLPGVFGYLAMPALKPNVQRVLLVERNSGAPVLTDSRVGLGRVLFLGIDETWRWRRAGGRVAGASGEDDAHAQVHDRFWLQLVRYAAEEPYAALARDGTDATGRQYALDVEKVSLQPGEPLRVRARVLEEDGSPARESSQTLRVMRDGQLLRTVTMPATGPAGSGRYHAALTDLPEGDYELQLGAAHLPVRIAPSDEMELADLSADPERLRRLAQSSGGEYLGLDQIHRLPQKLRALSDREGRMTELSLWDSHYLFLFVLGCLGAEWALRKRLGLA